MLKVLQFVTQLRSLITQAAWDAVLRLIADFQSAVADGTVTLGEWSTIITDVIAVWSAFAQTKLAGMTNGELMAEVEQPDDLGPLVDQLTVAVRQEGGNV